MDKPKSVLKRNFKLRKPVAALAKRQVKVVAAPVKVANNNAKVMRLFTDVKPKPEKLGKRPLVSKGMTLKRLLAKTKPQQIELSAAVVIKNVRRMWHKRSSNPVIVTDTYSKRVGKKATGYDRYVTYIEAQPTKVGNKFSETLVKVGCSCPFFLFYAEYALHKYLAADIQFSNGEPPVDRNPKQIPLLCKHLVKLVDKVQEKGI